MSETKPVLWNRNFVQCCISYFLMNFAFYMLMPTMPVYLVEELGISTSEVGMVLSSYTIGLLCVRSRDIWWIVSPANRYMYSPSRYSPVCLPVIGLL